MLKVMTHQSNLIHSNPYCGVRIKYNRRELAVVAQFTNARNLLRYSLTTTLNPIDRNIMEDTIIPL